MKHSAMRSAHSGFSLVEAMVATVIISLAVTSFMLAMGSGTRINDAGLKLTQAVFLAQQLREWTVTLPFSDPDPGDANNAPGNDGSDPQVFVDDLDDLMGVTYSPPRNGLGAAITDMADWSQQISITWRDPDNLTSTVTAGSSDFAYVEVTVSRYGQPILTTGWFEVRRY